MLFKVNFSDRGGVYATVEFDAVDPEEALAAGRRWALEHISKRPLRMSVELPLEMQEHGRDCPCAECSYERDVAKLHRRFSRGLLTSTEYATELSTMSQAFLSSQMQTA